jgi:hypothetical protein
MPGSSLAITGVTPQPAPVGSSVTIAGTGFGASQGQSTVVIGGIPATVSSWSNTAIVAVVPSGSSTNGAVQVFASGYSSNEFPFSIGAIVTPVIASLSLAQGPATMGFVITGANFGAFQGLSSVYLGSNPIQGLLTVLTWGPSSITVQIPTTIVSSGNVVVSFGGIPSNGMPFTLTPPFGCSVP